ncbi:MAG: family 1 extracellular solute-binding protein, partial [Paenibacillaceae bacterium]|nr:family 1 extracellular solute-binding protein [Paenibacillaceae bacterium]
PVNVAPLTLSMYQYQANISDEEFQRFMVEPVKKKYPNISLQLIRRPSTQQPAELVATGNVPDMVFGALESIQPFLDVDIPSDLTALTKKNKTDLNKFDPASVSAIQMRSTKGELIALPFSVNFSALYYNKEIFDKFAVPYPKDGMTWEETVQLAKRVTQMSGGTQYQGIGIDGGNVRLGGQLSAQFVDAKTNKATFATDGWKRVFDVMKMIDDIPGNKIDAKIGARQVFLKDRTLAMLSSQGARVGEIEDMFKQGNPLPWDVASLPSFKEAKGKGFGPDTHLLMISKTSKHKDEAFQVISVLTSIEVQSEMSKWGRLSSLKDAKAKEAFGVNLQSLKGVHVQSITSYAVTPDLSYSPYSILAQKPLNQALGKALSGATDINTALREADESANQAIATEMRGSK